MYKDELILEHEVADLFLIQAGKLGTGLGGLPKTDVATTWEVSLPHQCDRWEITRDQATREQAIADLLAFIENAITAVTVLRTLNA